jgi:hypothetical protein
MEAQSTFLVDHPVMERIHIGFEHGQAIVIEHFPHGQLPETHEAMGLSDKDDHYLLWDGDDGRSISKAAYERIKAGRIQV